MNDSSATKTDATMAVFLDLENLARGAKDANFPPFDIKAILDRLKLRGDIVVKKAYSHFTSYKEITAGLHQAAFELIELPSARASGKNSADIRMVVDALDLCYMKPHIDTFVIVSGDSDFSPLVSKLRENNKTVIGVGVKNSSSDLFIENCDDFIYYDDLARRKEKARAKPLQPAQSRQQGPTREKAIEQLMTTIEALVEERGDDQLYFSLIKPALKRLNPGFNHRAHGFASFNDLLLAARDAKLIELETEGKFKSNYGIKPVKTA